MDSNPENGFQNANGNKNSDKKEGGTPEYLLSDFLKRFHAQSTIEKQLKGEDLMGNEKGKGILSTLLNERKENKENGKEQKTALVEKLHDEIIRPELNIEKHADFIFIPAHSKKVRDIRKREGYIAMADGTTGEASLEIIPLKNGKTPTTTTRRVYLALQYIYENRRKEGKLRPDGSMAISSREIMRAAMITAAGKNIKIIHEELETLRTCIFRWVNNFVGENGERYSLLGTASILDIYERATRTTNKNTSEDKCQASHLIRFGEHIRKNLDANKTKPVNYTTILSIQGEIALVLYTRLDIILSDKIAYSRTSEGLFEDLHIDDPQYAYPSVRKRIIEKAIKELDGRFISTGLLKLKLERTADGSDWKIVAQKLPILPLKPKSLVRIPANESELITLLGEDIGHTIGEYDIKRRLYETFAIHYQADIIYQAISEFKSEGKTAKHKVKFFTAILHRLAHQRGKEWIKPCPADCKYKPQKS